MNRLLLAVVGLAAIATSSALANDISPGRRYMPPPRAQPVYVPYFTWNGLYAGLNAGYGFGSSNWTNPGTGASTGNFNVSGALIGGTIGYNWQLSAAVVGLEWDLDWSNIKGSSAAGCAGPCKTSNTWLGTMRGRLGYAFDRTLPYITGGAAYGDIHASLATGGGFSDAKMGWTIGGGVEHAFANNWSAKVEYLYVDLGTLSCSNSCSVGVPLDVTFKTSIVRAGVNYKF
jgi:outer membrane immunogenic protein